MTNMSSSITILISKLWRLCLPGYSPEFTLFLATKLGFDPFWAGNPTAFCGSYPDAGTKWEYSQLAKFMGPTWAHLGPVDPRWAPCWPHEPCYQGTFAIHAIHIEKFTAGSTWLWLTTTQRSLDRHLHTHWARAVSNKVRWFDISFNSYR